MTVRKLSPLHKFTHSPKEKYTYLLGGGFKQLPLTVIFPLTFIYMEIVIRGKLLLRSLWRMVLVILRSETHALT